ncbi:MAG TPA: hypothetical protein VL131_07595 [Gammaproteobacteria bacterium]|nr:hypothetical protein [Gammaproteobacteria bacterium]
MYSQATAPQTIGGVLDSGFKLFSACFTQVFWLAAISALATAPISLLQTYNPTNSLSGGFVALLLCGILVGALVAGVIYGAVIARIDAVARSASLRVGEALAIGLRRLPAMFVAGLLAGLVTGVGLILLIIPGLIFMIWFVFAPNAVIVERVGPIEALGYSRALVRGHWWRTAALLTIVGIIVGVVYVILIVVVGVLVVSNPSAIASGQTPWYLNFIAGPLLAMVAVPLTYALLLSIYYDLKTRLEGGDLAARIAATA